MSNRWVDSVGTVVLLANLFYLSYAQAASNNIRLCDAEHDSVVQVDKTTYEFCQRPPLAIGQTTNSQGVWIQWKCPENSAFDRIICSPTIPEEDHLEIMQKLAFCAEHTNDQSINANNSAERLTCNTKIAPLLSDINSNTLYYLCKSDVANETCGHWHVQKCPPAMKFNATIQQCYSESEALKKKLGMRQGYMPYIPQYAVGMPMQYPTMSYGYPYAYPQTAMYPTMVGSMPQPYGSGFPMQGLHQYYMSMYPWLYPGAGPKPGCNTGCNNGGGGGGGGAPSPPPGGGGSGGGGGGIPGLDKIPGLGGGGGGIPGLDKIPGLGGGGGGLPKVPGLDKVPGVGGLLGKLG